MTQATASTERMSTLASRRFVGSSVPAKNVPPTAKNTSAVAEPATIAQATFGSFSASCTSACAVASAADERGAHGFGRSYNSTTSRNQLCARALARPACHR